MDLWHEMVGDLDQDATGDLRTAISPDEGRQRVLRRLLTNAGAYIWHPSYGAGLPAFVGQTVNVPRITAIVRVQMAKEYAVTQTPPPNVLVQNRAGSTTVTLSISYVDAVSGTQANAAVTL